ncbi:MAG TPA: hypothetical protein VGI47_01110 [Candidatus Binataceae bacterium]
MNGQRARLLTAVLIILAGCAYEIVRAGSINQAKTDEVVAGIQKLRGLRFKRPVPILVEDRAQAQRDLILQTSHDYSDERLALDGAAGAMIGLYPPGINLKQESIGLLTDQVAGFYDPYLDRMVLVKGSMSVGLWVDAVEFASRRNITGEMLLAHELTHALQDQNFGLQTMLEAAKDSDDRALALKSVAEGDATIAGFAYVMGGMSQALADRLIASLNDISTAFASETKGTPEGLSAPLLFQYTQGVRFVAEAWRRGGWSAVNTLYANPPQSSQQIAQPALYFEKPTWPDTVRVMGFQDEMEDWQVVDTNTVGEFSVGLILKQRSLGTENGQDPAKHWAGDEMITLKRKSSIGVIWMIAFDDDWSAEHFAAAYVTPLDEALGGTTPHEVDYRGNAVLVLIGEPAEKFRTIGPSIWAASLISHR